MINHIYTLFLSLPFGFLAANNLIYLGDITTLNNDNRGFIIGRNNNLNIIKFRITINLIIIFNKNNIVVIFKDNINFLIIIISFTECSYLLINLDFLNLCR